MTIYLFHYNFSFEKILIFMNITSNMQEIKNKPAIITGGSKGIGFGIARSMVDQYMNVLITGRSQDAIDKAVAQLNESGRGKAIGMKADVRNLTSQDIA
jgi:NAD(P)-dependent dehydrogenase (short-subunit alcohol dehydrogenase family)